MARTGINHSAVDMCRCHHLCHWSLSSHEIRTFRSRSSRHVNRTHTRINHKYESIVECFFSSIERVVRSYIGAAVDLNEWQQRLVDSQSKTAKNLARSYWRWLYLRQFFRFFIFKFKNIQFVFFFYYSNVIFFCCFFFFFQKLNQRICQRLSQTSLNQSLINKQAPMFYIVINLELNQY